MRKSSFLCKLCGFLTRNQRKWIFRKNGLRVCDHCKEDFLLFGVPNSAFSTIWDLAVINEPLGKPSPLLFEGYVSGETSGRGLQLPAFRTAPKTKGVFKP